MSKLSVILRTRNAKSLYRESFDKCMESLKRQKLRDFELVVADMGSKDDTLKEIKRTGLNVKITVGKGTMSQARWLGAEAASSNIVFFLDADQELEPTVLEEVVELMRANDCVIVPEKSVGRNLISNALAAERNCLFLTLSATYPGIPRAYKRDKLLKAKQNIRPTDLREVFEDMTAYKHYLRVLDSPRIGQTRSMLYHYERSTLAQFFKRELKNGIALPNFFQANTREGEHDVKNYIFLEPRVFRSRYGVVLFLLKGIMGLAWITGIIYSLFT